MTAAIAGEAFTGGEAATAARAASGSRSAQAVQRAQATDRAAQTQAARARQTGRTLDTATATADLNRRQQTAPPPAPAGDRGGLVGAPARAGRKAISAPAQAGQRAVGSSPSWLGRTGGPSDVGGGFVLAVFFWVWIGLPYLQGGPTRVKDTIRAKFLNKGPDGEWLP